MSKIWSSLGLAVLGIAILVGSAAAATSAGVHIDGTLDEITMAIDAAPLGDSLDYIRGVGSNVITGEDSITVSSNTIWDLTVSDTNIASSNYDGKMRKYVSGAYESSPEVPLTNGFKVGLESGTLYDLFVNSGTYKIVNDEPAGSSTEKNIAYSQTFDNTNDAAGTYRIDLTYSIAYSV